MVNKKERNHLRSETLGFKTRDALKILADEIEELVHAYETKFHKKSLLIRAKNTFAKPYESPLSWFSVLTTIFAIVCLALTKYYCTSICVLCILLATVALVVYESYSRQTEIFRKVRLVKHEIELAQTLCKDWTPANYPNVCNPMSPCVTLQLTYRDGQIVNLPWALLVKNDVIVIRPGHTAPGDCVELSGKRQFTAGETYGLSEAREAPTRPTARTPFPDIICTLNKTPFLDNLRKILEKSPKRPPTIYNQQRHLLVTKYIQHWGVIACLLMTLLFASLHYNNKLYDDRLTLKWINLFVELPLCSILPVIPLMFPIMWIAINLWGIARLETHLAQPQVNGKFDQQRSFQEDLDTPTLECETTKLSFKEVFFNWIQIWRGYSMLLGRSSNVVQVLGSITALCCVDKKGILSWPNPTAEKVFILRDADESESSDSKRESSTGSEKDEDDVNKGKPASCKKPTKEAVEAKASDHKRDSGRIIDTHKHPGTLAEVLDLTHEQNSAFRIEFDDHSWKKHIDSLKPLGLAILMNTCCQKTQEHYSKFCAHVMAVATIEKDLVPVTNRYDLIDSQMNSFMHGRCLCELAKQIGFTDKATELFNLEGQIASYMHLQPEIVKRDIRFARHLRLASKVKVPFPHCLSVVMRDLQSNSLQMLTQGTADIILDCCEDFWDGHDLRPLGQQERKRAQDFYQRNALTSYCTAFAYRPLRHGITGALGETAYMELPAESTYKANPYREHERGGIFCTFDGTQGNCEPSSELKHSLSSDSLLFSDNNKEEDVCDVEGCFEMQCHQIFIGMITMQYQVQTDMVSMIEKLERACIRFVHFSKENELRSRVFSEKMGLESGWNCHISLLSDDQSNLPSPQSQSRNIESEVAKREKTEEGTEAEKNRLLPPAMSLEASKNLSSSAPGAINDEIPLQSSIQSFNGSKDSAMEDENCRSLSGYTDSTDQSAPVNFDMSNRAKLPRGIQNIRPHLENVDNVPLLVSLFTDCSAEATREMLQIMQTYGEIVVCVGSSASAANADIFLQADCSVAIEPLYPQICQSEPAYTESNILNNRETMPASESVKNKKWFEYEPSRFHRSSTISPIYLSRQLNAIPCSVAVNRDDSFSIIGMIELSRRFSNGLWNCFQFWMCCACTLSIINTICACLALPPILTPLTLVYLMCVVVPLISTTLVNNEADPEIMNRATAKKHSMFDSKMIAYVMFSYGFKFIPTIFTMVFTFCLVMSHPVDVLDLDIDSSNLDTARCFILFGIILHFIVISISFVHRDYSVWKKNPLSNRAWLTACNALFVLSSAVIIFNLVINDKIVDQLSDIWPIILFLVVSVFIVFLIVELCKWQELKANIRYQRRARLDFGTKLGMNSPF